MPAPENTNAHIKAVVQLVEVGKTFPEIILVATNKEGPVVLVEGHTRATSYVLASQRAPEPVSCLFGISNGIRHWAFWGDL